MAPTYVTVQARGTIALPADVRKRHHLDEPGAQVQVVEREDGVIELHPTVPVPASQAWFWTEEWQAGEREVDEELARGDYQDFASGEELMAHLRRIAAE
jgi:bifunctional DNA-binding transcriptional regulator/antitoxin component of YhaV-PrlF toxin-antitoxin module